MAKMTLLDMVQDILSEMLSDSVNSISDTEEAGVVAGIIRNTFFQLSNDRLWPTQYSLFKLTPSADSNRPTHMRIEDDVAELQWVKYDCRVSVDSPIKYLDIEYMPPGDFLSLVMSRQADAPDTAVVMDYSGTPLIIKTNTAPTYYTTFDDKHLVFDSYNSAVDSTLQHSKTQAYGAKEPSFLMEDDFVPELPSKAFPYLLAEAKSTAMLTVKEVFNQKTEQAAARQKAWLSRNKRRNGGGIKFPDYGRK